MRSRGRAAREALVLYLDEKSPCQALKRIRSMLTASLLYGRQPYGRRIGTRLSTAPSVLF